MNQQCGPKWLCRGGRARRIGHPSLPRRGPPVAPVAVLAAVAVARKLVTLAFYALRHGELRCLTRAA